MSGRRQSELKGHRSSAIGLDVLVERITNSVRSLRVRFESARAETRVSRFEEADNSYERAPANFLHHQSQTQCAAKGERTLRLGEDGQISATPLAR